MTSVIFHLFKKLSMDLYSSYISKKGCKAQESLQSSTAPDPGYQWESNKLIVRRHKREPRANPFGCFLNCKYENNYPKSYIKHIWKILDFSRTFERHYPLSNRILWRLCMSDTMSIASIHHTQWPQGVSICWRNFPWTCIRDIYTFGMFPELQG